MTTNIFINNIERKLFWILAGFLGVAAAFYLFSILSLTMSVVAHDRLTVYIREVSAEVSLKEGEYVLLQNGITRVRAQELGFKEADVKFAGEETMGRISLNR